MNTKILKIVSAVAAATICLTGCTREIKEPDFFEPFEQVKNWDSSVIKITLNSDIEDARVEADLTGKSDAAVNAFELMGTIKIPSSNILGDITNMPTLGFDTVADVETEDSEDVEFTTIDVDIAAVDDMFYLNKDTLTDIIASMGMFDIFGDVGNQYLGFPMGSDSNESSSVVDVVKQISDELLNEFKNAMYTSKDVFFSVDNGKAILTINKDNFGTFKDCTASFIESFDDFKQEKLEQFKDVLEESEYTNLVSAFSSITSQSLADAVSKLSDEITNNDASIIADTDAGQDQITFNLTLSSESGNITAKIICTKEQVEIAAREDVLNIEDIQEQ